MASSLSQSTATIRKVIIGFIIFAIIMILLQALIDSMKDDETTTGTNAIPRSVYATADSALGKLTRPQIKSIVLQPGTRATFALSGNKKFSEFPPVANAYVIEEQREKLGDADKARTVASNIGFSLQESKSIDGKLIWEVPGLTRSLNYDKASKTFKFDVSLSKDPAARIPAGLTEDEQHYSNLGPDLLRTLKLDAPELESSMAVTNFVDLEGSTSTIKKTSYSQASYARISLIQQLEACTLSPTYRPQEGATVYKTILGEVRKGNYMQGQFNATIQGKGDVASQDFVSFDVSKYTYGKKGVYPIKTITTAWNEVQENKGYLYWLMPDTSNPFEPVEELNIVEFKANPESTRIVYIEPEKRSNTDASTQILQPYYMFEGSAYIKDGRTAQFAFVIEAITNNQYQ